MGTLTHGHHHGFSFKGALVIAPGTEQSFPIPVAESSVLDIGWSVEDEQDLEFSVSFTPDGSSEMKMLVPAERAHGKEHTKFPVEGAGRCAVLWRNCYVGWLGGTARKVSYTATLHTNWELEDEARRKKAHAKDERERLQQAEEAERLRAAREEEKVRRQESEAKLSALRTSAEVKQKESSELLGSAARKREEADTLRKKFEALEASLKEELTRSATLALEASAENKEARALRLREYEISKEWPMNLQVSLIRATGLKHLNFTGDNPWCKCTVKQNSKRDKDASKCVTKVAPKTLEPVWNETHEIDWRLGESLEFHVYDQGTVGSKEEGKGALLACDRFFPAGLEEDLVIDGLEHATLRVRIVPLVDQNLPPVQEPHWPVTVARWSTDQMHDLGKDPGSFNHKARLLAGYDSPASATEALNSGNIDIPKAVLDQGYCVVLHSAKQTHVLLYRSDALETVAKLFKISTARKDHDVAH